MSGEVRNRLHKPGLVKYTYESGVQSSAGGQERDVSVNVDAGGHCEADWEKQNAIYMPFLWNGYEDGME